MRPTFEEVYKEHFRYIQNLVRRRVPPDDVDDLVQMIFAGVARGLWNYHPALPLKPWLKTIAARTLRDYFRRTAPRLAAEEPLDEEPCDTGPSEEGERDQMEQLALLPLMLDGLEERHREIVVRHKLNNEPMDAIAEEMGLSERGGYKLLEVAMKELEAAGARHQATLRRRLREQRRCLLPLGLAFRPQAWIARARSAPGRALTKVRAAWASVAAASVVVALGAMVLPPLSPSATTGDEASNIAVMAVAAPAPLSANDALEAATAAATLPAFDTKSAPATQPASSVQRAGEPPSAADLAELASLRALMNVATTDPNGALAALEQHKKKFPLEKHRHDREGIEARVLKQR